MSPLEVFWQMIKTNQTVIAMMVIANDHGIVRQSAYSGGIGR